MRFGSPIVNPMRIPTTILAALMSTALGVFVVADSPMAWWPEDSIGFDTKTARTSVPGDPARAYAFEFAGSPVDSSAWSTIVGAPPPGGQIGRLEGMTMSQAALFANKLSQTRDLPTCYDIADCEGEPSTREFECGTIEPEPLSCKGYRLPLESEVNIMGRIYSQARIAQWTHSGTLDDARGVHEAGEDAKSVAGIMVVRTVEIEPQSK